MSQAPAGRRGRFRLRRYDCLAPLYDRIDLAEILYKRGLRPRLFEGLGGKILEAGIGTGCNLPFHPPDARVIGFDLSPAMLAQARRRGERLNRPVGLVAMNVLELGFPDRAFDAVVAAFLFGTLRPDQQGPAIAELARVCRPGGELRILDYVLSPDPLRRFAMTLWLPWQKAVYGGAFDRRPERHMTAAGFEPVREVLLYKDFVRLLVARRRTMTATAPQRTR